MTINDFNLTMFISNYSPYYQLMLTCILLTGVMVFSRFSENTMIGSGIYVFSGWMFVCFVLSFFAEAYWYYLLHWFLSALVFFAYWFLSIYLCGRFGSPYMGDGGMVMIIPIYLLPVVLAASLGIKVIIVVFRSLL